MKLRKSQFMPMHLTNISLDPNAPKRGLSAYMFFANEQRENVRDENPGISFGTINPTAAKPCGS